VAEGKEVRGDSNKDGEKRDDPKGMPSNRGENRDAKINNPRKGQSAVVAGQWPG